MRFFAKIRRGSPLDNQLTRQGKLSSEIEGVLFRKSDHAGLFHTDEITAVQAQALTPYFESIDVELIHAARHTAPATPIAPPAPKTADPPRSPADAALPGSPSASKSSASTATVQVTNNTHPSPQGPQRQGNQNSNQHQNSNNHHRKNR